METAGMLVGKALPGDFNFCESRKWLENEALEKETRPSINSDCAENVKQSPLTRPTQRGKLE
jgi:hypothetical protein